MEFDNTLIKVHTYQICFVDAKLYLFNDFFKGTWKTMFEERHGKLKQLQFEQRHLWSGDIGKLIQFLNDEKTRLNKVIDIEGKKLELELYEEAEHFNKHCPVLQQKLQNAKTDSQFINDLLKQLPPIQEKDVWFLFQKKVESLPVKAIYGTKSINNDFEKEDANSSI